MWVMIRIELSKEEWDSVLIALRMVPIFDIPKKIENQLNPPVHQDYGVEYPNNTVQDN